MDILMVAAELAPYVRVTEAGDAVPALAKALKQLGHRVTVVLPRYAAFEAHGLLLARRLTPLSAPGGDITVFDCQLSSGVEVVAFDLPGLTEPGALAAGGTPDPALLAAFAELGRAVAALVRQRELSQPVELVHAHDFPGAIAVAGLDPKVPCVLTVYDASRAGFFEAGAAGALPAPLRDALAIDGRPSGLAAGLRRASLVVTPSPTYAASLASPEVTGPLAPLFGALAAPVAGVSGGLDYASYNPAVDAGLEARYDAEDPWLKARTKGVVLREHRLELDIERPLAVFFGPLDRAHGADVLLAALPKVLRERLSLLVGGSPSDELYAEFQKARDVHPESLALVERRGEGTERRLAAAADLALVVTRGAAAETAHLVAQRYGALPVALATGSCVDGIVDVDAALETGTGFLFDTAEPASLSGALARALAAYGSEEGFARLRRRVMRLDLGWDRPARRYAQLYRRVTTGG
jgi:starch synthase